MIINDKKPPTVLPTSLTQAGANIATATTKTNAPKAFAQTLSLVQQTGADRPSALRTVSAGDTLIGLVRQQAAAQGIALKPSQEMRLAQDLAHDNGIQNPNLIHTGQKISFNLLQSALQSIQNTPSAPVAAMAPVPATPSAPSVPESALSNVSAVKFAPTPQTSDHPVLTKTLDRAVAKGFIPPAEKEAVYDKILQLASTHKFKPDDFARMTLMESDGMNPRASNQRCHGIIQFCDGPARGAATAGYAANPRAILDLSVHKQLGLVDKYFEEVGLKNQGPAGLEDLYLSVLKPAARSETQAAASLNISGAQSNYLHVGRDTSAPITRQSIRQGLLQNAADRLGQIFAPAPRLQAMRASKYSDNATN